MNKTALQQFTDTILAIMPAGWRAVTTESDVVYQLKQQAVAFAHMYQEHTASDAELSSCAQTLEGLLRTQLVVSPPGGQMGEDLIQELHTLLEAYSSPSR
jgi:predicted glycosyltransferase